ncbi:hypothetical protein [Actinophytocola sp.]|uniref:hypothetical protein n=1 Tax=Actinophytocola sp. TaxID=1872138 RepID=UPI002ED830BE
MLYLVLTLVLAAFGLLIAALTTANTLWAWISVTVSVIAAALLVFDWLGGRRRAAGASAPAAERIPVRHRDPEPPAEAPTEPPRNDAMRTGVSAAVLAVEPPIDRPVEPPVDRRVPEDDGREPDEEPTDASDLLVVSDLLVEVRVVDEHPRYHLATCGWLADKPTLPLPVGEARQLGFTPCARCGPDAVLAARHRAGR